MSAEYFPILTVNTIRRAVESPSSSLVSMKELSETKAIWNGLIYLAKRPLNQRFIGVQMTALGGDSTFEPDRSAEIVVSFYKNSFLDPRVVTYHLVETPDHLTFSVLKYQRANKSLGFENHQHRPWLQLDLAEMRPKPTDPVTVDQIDMDKTPHNRMEIYPDVRYITYMTSRFMEAAGLRP